jgi:hypothetical protein
MELLRFSPMTKQVKYVVCYVTPVAGYKGLMQLITPVVMVQAHSS